MLSVVCRGRAGNVGRVRRYLGTRQTRSKRQVTFLLSESHRSLSTLTSKVWTIFVSPTHSHTLNPSASIHSNRHNNHSFASSSAWLITTMRPIEEADYPSTQISLTQQRTQAQPSPAPQWHSSHQRTAKVLVNQLHKNPKSMPVDIVEPLQLYSFG